MNRSRLIRILLSNGWFLKRCGANHDIYTDGTNSIPVPRHNEINELLARSIIRKYKLKWIRGGRS